MILDDRSKIRLDDFFHPHCVVPEFNPKTEFALTVSGVSLK